MSGAALRHVKRTSWCGACAVAGLIVTGATVTPVLGSKALNTKVAMEVSWLQQYDNIAAQIKSAPRFAKHSITNLATEQAAILPGDRDPLDVILRRTRAFLDNLQRERGIRATSGYRDELARIEQKISAMSGFRKASASLESQQRQLFKEVAALNRTALLAATAVDFDSIIYIERNIWQPFGSDGGGVHMVFQYFGFNARQGGGLYLMKNIKSRPERVDILQNSVVENGRFAGRKLQGGAFLSPDLSYDGKTILFCWKEPVSRNNNNKSSSEENWDPQNCFHIFRVNIDGTGLRQLTDGAHNDMDPCWLPGGRIAFVSDRWGGYGRCFGPEARTFLLSSMKTDGTDIVQLSYHETNEWQPSVDNTGMLLYTRWDYVDRDACVAHHIWTCAPDGRDPRSYHGNYPLPYSTWEGRFSGQATKTLRPFAEFGCRAIPNSTKYVATASSHHSEAFGSLILLDVAIEDDNKMSQVTRLTPSVPFPESEDGGYGAATICLNCVYGTPWPLSESMFLCHYFPNNVSECNSRTKGRFPNFSTAGIYLIDRLGNQQLICNPLDTTMRAIDPIPVRPRSVPPSLPVRTYQGERSTLRDHPAVISIVDVRISDLPFTAGTEIKELRIIQVFPKSTPATADPVIGYGPKSLARMALGTVPVESDGSVNFEAPVGKAIYFQTLDSSGFAVQSMRSVTYAHSGEDLSCFGCHENKWQAPNTPSARIALSRPPSKIMPEVGGLEPVNFHRLVKPVLDAKCAPCHVQMARGPTDMGYATWKNYAYYLNGADVFTPACGSPETPYHGGSRTLPGKFGAAISGMRKYLSKSHYNVDLTKEELRRISLWLDCNSVELGAYSNADAQRRRELVWPSLGFERDNPLGVETKSNITAAELRILTPDAVVMPGTDFQFRADALDRFNMPTTSGRDFVWKVSGGGSINTSSGLLKASSVQGGPYSVTLSSTVNSQTLSASSQFQVGAAVSLPAGLIQEMHFLCGAGEAGSPYLSKDVAALVESTYTGAGKTLPTVRAGVGIPGLNPQPFAWRVVKSTAQGRFADAARDNFVAYASITIISPADRKLKIGCAHDDDFTAWLNGKHVVTMPYSSSGEQISTSFAVSKGENTFLFKLIEGSSGNYLAIRFLDEAGGEVQDLGRVIDYTQQNSLPTPSLTTGPLVPVLPGLRVVAAGRSHLALRIVVTGNAEHAIGVYSLSGVLVRKFRGFGSHTYSIGVPQIAAGTYVVYGRLGLSTIACKALVR